MFPIVLAIFVGVVVWFGRSIHDFLLPPADTVTVPSFVGQTETDATNVAQRLKLATSVIERTQSDRYPRGIVISQRPDSGTAVRQGRQVSFVVSAGLISRLMPDVRYQSMREVELDLSRSHLQVGKVTYQRSDVIPEDHVIDQDPQPSANVNQDDKVNLVVSRGGVGAIVVPNFERMTIDEARALAQRSGIKLGQVVWTPLGRSGPPHGTVTRQLPSAGAKINAYDPVSLQVSSGPNESGYIIRQVHVLASVPVPDSAKAGDSVKAVVRVKDETGNFDLFSGYVQPGAKLDFNVTAVGTSLVGLYVNDTLVGEARLGNEPQNVYEIKKPEKP